MGSVFDAPTFSSERFLLQGTNNLYCTVLQLQPPKQERQQTTYGVSMDGRKTLPLLSYQISFLHVLHIVWNRICIYLSVELNFFCLCNPSMICICTFHMSFRMGKITDMQYMMKSLRQDTVPLGKCWENTLIWP